MPNFTARDMRYPILLKMQNMTVKEPRNVLLLHYVSISFHTLYDIAFKCSGIYPPRGHGVFPQDGRMCAPIFDYNAP